jgi:hypothetical protein
LFIVPVVVLAASVSMRKQIPIKKRAFWITAALTAGCGILLDICFGLSFFTFLNRQHGSRLRTIYCRRSRAQNLGTI